MGFLKFSDSEKLMPQDEILETTHHKSSLSIGVPKELTFQENRVPIVPQAVGLLISNGHKVLIESSAGKPSKFSDEEYSAVGAQIIYNHEEIFKSDIIVKVAPPSMEEIDMMKSRQTIISSLQLAEQKREYFEKLMTKKTTALSYELIKDKDGAFPVLRSMSEVVGTAVIFIAAKYMESKEYGRGTLFGGFPGITPTEVVILGAGTVAEYAAKASLGLGAVVKVFDNSLYKLRRFQNTINSRVFTSIIQPLVLKKSLRTADVVIGAVHANEGVSPCLVTEDMISQMKEGAVIVDVSIDQGGCFETSKVTNHNEPVFKKFGVTHYCVPNIASKVSHTASYAFSNFLTPVLINMGEKGGMSKLLQIDFGVRQGAYLYNGTLTKSFIGNKYTLPFQNIELLIAALR